MKDFTWKIPFRCAAVCGDNSNNSTRLSNHFLHIVCVFIMILEDLTAIVMHVALMLNFKRYVNPSKTMIKRFIETQIITGGFLVKIQGLPINQPLKSGFNIWKI